MVATTAAIGNGSPRPDEMNNLAVSYMGKPLHFLASVVWALLSRFLSLFLGAKRRAAGDQGASFNKPVSPLPRQPLVRLKNLPQSEEYFINTRGNVIHFRSYLPQSADAIKAVVLFSHGYGAHCNSPRKHQMGMAMPEQGVCMYQIDLEGHGYSGGERAYIEDYNHWVDDYRQLLELVAGDGMDAGHHGPTSAGDEAEGIAPYLFTSTATQRKRLREVPIFIAGESLGGALSILLGLSLYETNHPLLPRFKGEVLLAPAIKGNPPPPALVAALRHFVVPLVPRWQIPSCLESVNRPDMCVLEVDERRHANHDVLGYPGGLGWGGNMRFRTGLNLIDLTAEVSRRLEHVKFPFLIMHDPGDCIVRFDSSEELAFRASTPHGSPRGRELRPMNGWLHCLLTNCPEIAIQHLQDWILYQTRLGDPHHHHNHQPCPGMMVGLGPVARRGITKRGASVTRKSVTGMAVPAHDGLEEANVSDDAPSAKGGVDRSLNFDDAGAGRGHAASAGRTFFGGCDGSNGAPGDNPAGSQPPHMLLDLFPKTAAAAAVTAATMAAAGAAVVSGDADGEAEPRADPCLTGDLDIDSPSSVAPVDLIGVDGGGVGGMIDGAAAAAASTPDATKRTHSRGRFV